MPLLKPVVRIVVLTLVGAHVGEACFKCVTKDGTAFAELEAVFLDPLPSKGVCA